MISLHFELGLLDALGNLDLLFAGEQGDLPHLLEVHADRIIQDVEFAIRFLVLFFFFFAVLANLLDSVDIRRINDLDLHGAELGDNQFYAVRVVDALGKASSRSS